GVIKTMSFHHATWAPALTGVLSFLVLAAAGAVVAPRTDQAAANIETAQQTGANQSTTTNNAALKRVFPSPQEIDRPQQPVDVYCRVEGSVQIIFVLPEGKRVRKDELICELDSAVLWDALTTQKIASRRAEAEMKQARLTVEVYQISVKEY